MQVTRGQVGSQNRSGLDINNANDTARRTHVTTTPDPLRFSSGRTTLQPVSLPIYIIVTIIIITTTIITTTIITTIITIIIAIIIIIVIIIIASPKFAPILEYIMLSSANLPDALGGTCYSTYSRLASMLLLLLLSLINIHLAMMMMMMMRTTTMVMVTTTMMIDD